jgi:hypothetical protein
MSEKNFDQIKVLYSELSKVGPSQDWERILKIAKKSTQNEIDVLTDYSDGSSECFTEENRKKIEKNRKIVLVLKK